MEICIGALVNVFFSSSALYDMRVRDLQECPGPYWLMLEDPRGYIVYVQHYEYLVVKDGPNMTTQIGPPDDPRPVL